MTPKTGIEALLWASVYAGIACAQPALKLNDREYFERPGLNVMVYQDIYPEGHQGGVNLIQNGVRVASNGDIRLGPTPGQWQPIPKQDKREVLKESNSIAVRLSYPDESRNRKGFNPIEYPDLKLTYKVTVQGEGDAFRIVVDLDQPLPDDWVGRVGFNIELYPVALFGRSWAMGGRTGIFPRQPNGPETRGKSGEIEPVPLASGPKLTVAPESDAQRIIFESKTGDLTLLDGRNQHNNGWFVVRSLVPKGATAKAIEWVVRANAIQGWRSPAVVHVSQVGYHPKQSKVAIVELDAAEGEAAVLRVLRVTDTGAMEEAMAGKPAAWGKFLRYNYATLDFTKVEKPGTYIVEYAGRRTEPFVISNEVFKRHVWQPTLEYFLPAQMCHMRVEEQYRVWHGLCHMDDARMAPVSYNHFDGYLQGASTLTRFKPGDTVPHLNAGGWHDAGDDDLRIESQADEVWILASAYEAFGEKWDDTTVDQGKKLVKIHQPDGKPDLLQQVEHGVLTILGGYRGMGRLYRGMIVPALQQYVLLGDTANVTDNLFHDASMKPGQKGAASSAEPDDRWVFTEQNPGHEYKGIAALAIAGRVLRDYDPALAAECITAAEALWRQDREASPRGLNDKIAAAVELWLTTKKPAYEQAIVESRQQILARIDGVGWVLGRVVGQLQDRGFAGEIRKAVAASQQKVRDRQRTESPFGVPYRPHIWGAGWDIQRFGVQQYFLHRGFPESVTPEYMLNALNFVLGVHPGDNTAAFPSGVGAKSMTIAYGFNRADYSYIPGGVTSGTALIRPDFPEMKDFPYLWQQSEYVLGGGASNYMFLVLAADQVLSKR